jgi:hypothetical protein
MALPVGSAIFSRKGRFYLFPQKKSSAISPFFVFFPTIPQNFFLNFTM